ncbi:magnesium chelatase subunit D family protein [soil metagenome]
MTSPTDPTPPAVASAAASRPIFPFSAVVGAQQAKLGLILATVDPHIGGVLLRGDKGSAKSTLARALAALLPGSAPFTELPLGATEERVVGSLDLAAALGDGQVRLQPGLLAAAHGGLLYVDEVNLLADHLVDVLLDVAVSGRNRVEREGLSQEHPARFVLVGTMNPEEGDLRPQLLDRFGLAVDVQAEADPGARVEAVRRRLAFDADPVAFAAAWADAERQLAARLVATVAAQVDGDLLAAVCEVCATAGAEGLRADLTLTRAAAAHAGWEGRATATAADVRAVARLVLTHRARQHPLDPPGTTPEALDDALDQALGPEEPPPPPPIEADDDPHGADHRDGADDGRSGDRSGRGGAGPTPGHQGAEPGPGGDPRNAEADVAVPVATLRLAATEAADASGRRSPVTGPRGRTVGSAVPEGRPRSIAVVPTLTAAAGRWAGDPGALTRVSAEDLREPVRETRTGNLLVLAVDASGSMGAAERMAAVKGALLGLLMDAYQRRDRVALVTFGGAGAHVVLRPTGSVEVARARLEELPTGGDTPLAEGIAVAADLATHSATPARRPLLVLVTDGRGTAGAEPWAAAVRAAEGVARRRLPSVVVDVEAPGRSAVGLGPDLARAMAARHLTLPELTAGRLETTLRSL